MDIVRAIFNDFNTIFSHRGKIEDIDFEEIIEEKEQSSDEIHYDEIYQFN